MHGKGNYKQGEMTTLRMGENNSKWNNWQGLIAKIYKQLIQLNTRKTNNSIKKWEKDLNRHFSREDIQMTNKHMKRFSTSLIYERNANQNCNEISPHTVRMTVTKKSTNNKCWRSCGEKRMLFHCWWECKLMQPLWKTVWRFLKKLGIKQPYDPQYHF